MNTISKKKVKVKVPTPSAKAVKSKTKEEKMTKKVIEEKTKDVDLNNLTADEIFLQTLKEIGAPSRVRDMVALLKKNKRVSIAKKKLLIKFYASASHLNRDGVVKRTPVNGSMYAYSLLGWKKNKTKAKLSVAA